MSATVAATPAVPTPGQGPTGAVGAVQSSSLWVGELLPEVTEAQLFDIFNNVGPVASVRVCRDAVTRRSLGYAYVNFQSHADADRALDTMNYELVNGKPCRIMWCQRDPTVRRSGVGNIFVKGLDPSIDNKALFDAFSIFGNILSVKVVLDGNGQSTGRGFVHFEAAQDARDAIEKADGTLLKDKKINVALFKSRKERLEEAGRTENQFKNVFIKNLDPELSESDLTNIFKPFGEITSLVLARDPSDPSKSRGFGFVCFGDSNAAKDAVEQLNGKEIKTKVVYVGRAMKKSERANYLRREYESRRKENQNRSRGVNLYVKNLDEGFDDNKLRTSFEEYGTITSAKVMRDDKGNSRGFGFVCFATQEEATRALTENNGRMIDNKPLYVALAQPREERRQHLALQYRQRMQFQRQQPGFMAQGYPMFIGGPFQGQRQPQPFYAQRPLGGAPGRYGQGAGFGGQYQGGVPRQPRPAFSGPRPQAIPGPRGPLLGQPRPNTRYSNQARNIQQPLLSAQPSINASGTQHLATVLASSDPERQKQILGDHLYPLVAERFPQAAGKLTGMLLQMDNSELLHLLEDPQTLQQELEKANEVLRTHVQ